MASVKDVATLYQNLKTEWAKKPRKLDKCGELLNKIKIALTHLSFLPSNNEAANQKELILGRDVLEIGAQWAVATKDVKAFERYMSQLKCYYFDYKDHLPESAFTYQLLGLNLLFLLAQNRVAEFHTELERLPVDVIRADPYVKHPLALEQYLMEGSYNKIFLAKDNVPAESYTLFMDTLLDTVRGEIAACIEKAYLCISSTEAARRLNLPNQQAVLEYGKKRNWTLGADNCYHFNAAEETCICAAGVFPSAELAEQTIEYARHLEMIV
ncbi:26S proteasome non-ATPase regulatory subunit 8 [Danaus plexippus]|uniref:26S proteasome non-ATPase regulatory subunit 8 n=1 Tax=Danaus plexippus plexippus TaxID=278856 RepID=A0A212FHJ4_DANPL|nr:26S proteasome non-ATPase regulatory subunit 8 [Danaus plexippus]OWR53213.1 26S proteasome non-ATPase regulatory subunit 8 [Danaus plexippus plexippus]